MLNRLVEFVRSFLDGHEPVVLINLVAGAAAAVAAAVNEVDPTDETALAVAGVWAVVTYLQRQRVTPTKKTEAVNEYTQWLEEESFKSFDS